MKSNTPWSVKGIDPEAREAAKVAARRAGMTLGEWLNSLILQSGEMPEGYSAELADQESVDVNNGDESGSESEPIDELQERLESLNRRLDHSDRQGVVVSGIDQSIERLASTIETSRRLMASGDVAPKSAVNEIAARLERLQARLDEVASQKRTGIDPRTLMALERAIAGVASHIEKSDRRNTELVQSVEDALGQVDARVEGAEESVNTAISRVDLALDRLSGRLDSAEGEHRRTSARFNERLSQIDERISTVATDRDSTIAALERRLSGFETRLQNAQSRIEAASLARSNIPPDAISRSELEEWTRRQASDQGAEIAALKRSVGTVETRLGTLVERLDRMREDTASHVRDVERKAEEAEAAARAAAETPPQRDEEATQSITEIRSSVADIAARFDHANQTATETMSALEGVLRSLTRRLDSIEGRQGRAAETPMLPTAPRVLPSEPEAHEAEPEPELPKRPSWSWGIAQRAAESEETEAEEEMIGAASAEATEAEIAEDELQRQESLHVAGDAEDVFEVVPDESESHHAEDVSEGSEPVEATFSPEDERIFERLDEAHGGEAAETEEREEGAVDLSKLVFDLGDARERAPEPDGWQPSSEGRVVEELAAEPAVEAGEEGGWLEQARRAAKAASPSDRVADFEPYEEENSARRGLLIAVGVVVALVVVAALAWFVGRPWLEAHRHAAGSAQTTTAQPAAPAPAAKPQAAPGERAPLSPAAPAKAPEQGAAATNAAAGTPAAAASTQSESGQPAAGTEATTDTSAAASADTTTATTAPDVVTSPKQAMEDAANGGNAKAEYALALGYKNGGDDLAADPAKALDWMTKAANQGLAVAQRTLGSWYEQGDGVAKDLAKARAWYERSAQNGDVQAMHNLGFFYAEGEGGLTKNAAQAEKWFKSAAEKGLTDSQVNLAILYSQGNTFGIKPQMDKAYLWASIASERRPSDADAKKMRDVIAGALSAEDKAKIDKEVAAWKPQPVDIVANGGFDTNAQAFLPADQQPPLSRADIATVQKNLKALGYYSGPVNGYIDSQTVDAIKRFQLAYHLPQTGKANGDLLAALGAVPR